MPVPKAVAHVSVATSADSVPRFRTVDSWVDQQAYKYPKRGEELAVVEENSQSSYADRMEPSSTTYVGQERELTPLDSASVATFKP